MTAIMTENSNCMMYEMKAKRLPIGMPPLSTRCPPNHMMPTMEKPMMIVITGNMIENSRKTLTVVSVRSLLAALNRFSS